MCGSCVLEKPRMFIKNEGISDQAPNMTHNSRDGATNSSLVLPGDPDVCGLVETQKTQYKRSNNLYPISQHT